MLATVVRCGCVLAGLASASCAAVAGLGCVLFLARNQWRAGRFFGGIAVITGMLAWWAFQAGLSRRRASTSSSDESVSAELSGTVPPGAEEEAIRWAERSGQPVLLVAGRLTSLSSATAHRLCQSQPTSRGSLSFGSLASLTEEAAAVLVSEHHGPLSFPVLGSLAPGVARELSRLYYPLFLDGPKAICQESAAALGTHHGWLTLNGLASLSAGAAAGLASHPPIIHLDDWYNRLELNGLAEISEGPAAALSRYRGNLELRGLRSLSSRSAGFLASHRAADDAAEEFSLSLDGVTALTIDAACALARYDGGLSLNGVEELAPDALRAFATQGIASLSLASLRTMTDAVAALFGARPRRVILGGLRELAPGARAELCRNPLVILPGLAD